MGSGLTGHVDVEANAYDDGCSVWVGGVVAFE